MTVRQAWQKYADLEIDLLLAHVTKQPREFLLAHPNFALTGRLAAELQRLADKRRAGWPIAYLTGHKTFFGLEFKINQQVLIPRPESEWLVERAAEYLRQKKKSLRIIDIGTGSGNIIISLTQLFPKSQHKFFASDISAPALAIAKSNAKTHQAKIKFIKSDLFEGGPRKLGKFNLIVANLPYVPASDYKKLLPQLKLEPRQALTDGTNDFLLLQRFLQELPRHNAGPALVLMEIDPAVKIKISAWVKRCLPKAKLSFHKDLHGLWRYAEITIPTAVS